MIGPKDKWQVELSQVSKSGLIVIVERLAMVLGWDRELMQAWVLSAKSLGRSIDAMASYARFAADPDKEMAAILRRRKSAKRAARNRKRGAR